MKIVRNIIAIIGVTLLLNSCYSLDQEPYGRFAEPNSFKDEKDALFWRNGMYNYMRNRVYGLPMYMTDVQADMLNLRSPETHPLAGIHGWNDFTSTNNNVSSVWTAMYLGIRNINSALEGFNKIPQQTTAIEQYRGELYLGRAYYQTYLVTHFCKAYNPSTANTDLGLALFDDVLFKQFPSRSSLEATYNKILDDIAKAENILSGTATTTKNYTTIKYFNVDAVKALKARVLLYKQDWANAYAVSSTLIEGTRAKYPLITTKEQLTSEWHTDGSKESITQFAGYVDEPLSGANDIYLSYNKSMLNYSASFLPTKSAIDLYGANDIRKDVYFIEGNISGVRGVKGILVNKYADNELFKTNANTPSYLHQPKIFRIAEQYLIAAEAAYKKGDETNAKKYLNELREARGYGANSVTSTGNDLYTEIKDERTRELAFEGFRLYDLQRWQQDVVRGTPQSLRLINSNNPSLTYQLNRPYTDFKIVWPLSPKDIEGEEGRLQQNPGW